MGMKLPPDVARKVLAQAGQPSPARARTGPLAPASRVRLVVRIDGLALRSEANAGGRRRDKIARKAAVKDAVIHALIGLHLPPALPRPVRVVLTRVGGRPMDDDNLARAFKAVRDVVSRNLLEVDDGDRSAVRWVCRQRPGYSPAVVIVIG